MEVREDSDDQSRRLYSRHLIKEHMHLADKKQKQIHATARQEN